MTTTTFLERSDTDSPSSASLALDGGKSSRQYTFSVSSPTDILSAITQALGAVNTNVSSTGIMNRTMPAADPLLVTYFADTMGNLRGRGLVVQTSSQPSQDVPTIGDWSYYSEWDCSIEFSPRPYTVLPDSSITRTKGSWYPDVNTDSTGTIQYFYFANEWTRFNDIRIEDAGEYVTQQTGTMVFNSSGSANGKQYGASVQLLLPDYNITVLWYAVPARYYLSGNSYLLNKNWKGRVNQNAMQLPINGNNVSFPPGSLQYMGFKATPFTYAIATQANIYGNALASNMLCNIEMKFRFTTRELPTDEDVATSPTNFNYVVGGHNLLPWQGDRNFHYANLSPTSGTSRPSWLSAPLELLWTDPDTEQPNEIG